MNKNAANKIVFTSEINIGQNGAENDDAFLFQCFVNHPAIAQLRDMESPNMFALGSTGIGKTAILRMIAKQEPNCTQLELADMAMSKVGNSDTVGFLRALDLDLSLFFQALWKHVLCIEYIKLVSQARDEDRLRAFRYKVEEFIFGDRSKEKLEAFLKEHENQFWNTVDENVIEYTEALERGIQADLGAEVEKYSARAGYSRTLSTEKKVQLQQRAKKFVNPDTLSKIAQVINTLSEYSKVKHERFYILIDRVDEHWIDDDIKFQMISALFEALKGFQKLRNFKVVVALRNDIYERMKDVSSPSRQQLEKYEDYIVRIRWSKGDLRTLAEKRINHLFKRQYSKENVSFSDIFSERVAGGHDPWRYMIDRTLHRPRDVINFINMALRASENKSAVSRNDFRTAEQGYSELRQAAMLHEWSSTYPALPVYVSLLAKRPSYFDMSSFATEGLEEALFLKIGASESYSKDPIWKKIEKGISSETRTNPFEYASYIFERLHLIGAVGLKMSAESSWNWFHETSRVINSNGIGPGTKVAIHPMLRSALRSTGDTE